MYGRSWIRSLESEAIWLYWKISSEHICLLQKEKGSAHIHKYLLLKTDNKFEAYFMSKGNIQGSLNSVKLVL